MPVRVEFASALDTGRVRKNNEDSVVLDAACALAVLADGMGGYNAGEVASSMATSLVSEDLSGWMRSLAAPPDGRTLAGAMADSVARANRVIFDAANEELQYAGMGTTLVMMVVVGDTAVVGHVGDSRAYRFRDGRIERLTRDHSLLQEQLDAGLITAEQAARSVHRNLVTRAMGVEPEVTLETHQHGVRAGDLLLLCSDGLTDMLGDDQISSVLSHPYALGETCQCLVDAANACGGKDNISVVLARIGEAPTTTDRSWWSFWR